MRRKQKPTEKGIASMHQEETKQGFDPFNEHNSSTSLEITTKSGRIHKPKNDGIKRDRLGRRLDTRPAKRGPYKPEKADSERIKVDLGQAVKMRLINNMSYSQIARFFDVTPQTIHSRLKPLAALMKDPEASRQYSENRAVFMDSIEKELATQLLDKKKLKEASANNIAYALRQVHDIGRLERGQSTANVAVMTGLSETDRNWLSGMAEQLMGRMIAQDSGE